MFDEPLPEPPVTSSQEWLIRGTPLAEGCSVLAELFYCFIFYDQGASRHDCPVVIWVAIIKCDVDSRQIYDEFMKISLGLIP